MNIADAICASTDPKEVEQVYLASNLLNQEHANDDDSLFLATLEGPGEVIYDDEHQHDSTDTTNTINEGFIIEREIEEENYHDDHSEIDIMMCTTLVGTKYDSNIFEGACVDTGASSSVCGEAQAMAYTKPTNTNMIKGHKNVRFSFGDSNKPLTTIGKIMIKITHKNKQLNNT